MTEEEVKKEEFAMPHVVSASDVQYANDNCFRIVLVQAFSGIENSEDIGLRPRAVQDCPKLGNSACAFTPEDPKKEPAVCEHLAAGSGNIVFCRHTFHPVSRENQEEKPHGKGVCEPQGSDDGDEVYEGPDRRT